MRRLVLSSILMLMLTALAAPASAQTCSCTTYQSAQQFVQFNDGIFKGKVVSSKDEHGIATTKFQVLEKLKGDLNAFYSIRINDQYRVCFRWTDFGAEDVEIVDYH